MKKFVTLLGAMLLTGINAFAQSDETLKGDVNEDGIVDVADISSIIHIMASGEVKLTHYFYLGTTKPTPDNYKTLPGMVTSFISIDDAAGTTASIAVGETLYMLCPLKWMYGKTALLEEESGETFCFSEHDSVTISGYAVYSTRVLNDEKNVVLKTIAGNDEQKVVTTTIIVNRNSDNFNSIRDTINAINDASEHKRYIVFVPKGEWFECDINGKEWVKIVGESENETVIYCDGSVENKNTPADYSISSQSGKTLNNVPMDYKHCIVQRYDIELENLTIKVNDAKYCIHVGATDRTYDFKRLVAKNCTFIAGANTNCPIGIGAHEYSAYFENCTFRTCQYSNGAQSYAVGIHCHNHRSDIATGQLELNVINCLFDGCDFLNVGELGSTEDDHINLVNCHSTIHGGIYYYIDGSVLTNPDNMPYCIKVNALGSNVGFVGDWPQNDYGYTREKSLDYVKCDNYVRIEASGGTYTKGQVLRGILISDGKPTFQAVADAPVFGVVERVIAKDKKTDYVYIGRNSLMLLADKNVNNNYILHDRGALVYESDGHITGTKTNKPIGVYGRKYRWAMQEIILFNNNVNTRTDLFFNK